MFKPNVNVNGSQIKQHEVENLMLMLSSLTYEERKNAVMALNRMASRRTLNKKLIFNVGGIPILVTLLRDTGPHIRENSARILKFLAEDTTNRTVICKSGGVSLLLPLLHNAEPYIRENAASALRNLAIDPAIREFIFKSGGVTLIQVLSNGDENASVNRIFLDFLADMADYLLQLLENEEDAVKKIAVLGLKRLATQCDTWEAVSTHEAIYPLAILFDAKDDLIRTTAKELLAKVINRSDFWLRLSSSNPNEREDAVLILNLITHDDFSRQIIYKTGRNKNLWVKLLHDESPSVRENTVIILSRMANYVVQLGDRNTAARKIVIKAIMNVVIDFENHTCIDYTNIISALPNLASDSESDIQKNVIEIFENLVKMSIKHADFKFQETFENVAITLLKLLDDKEVLTRKIAIAILEKLISLPSIYNMIFNYSNINILIKQLHDSDVYIKLITLRVLVTIFLHNYQIGMYAATFLASIQRKQLYGVLLELLLDVFQNQKCLLRSSLEISNNSAFKSSLGMHIVRFSEQIINYQSEILKNSLLIVQRLHMYAIYYQDVLSHLKFNEFFHTLVQILSGKDENIKELAIITLMFLSGVGHKERVLGIIVESNSIAILINLLGDNNSSIKESIIILLSNMIDYIISMLSSSEFDSRKYAVLALHHLANNDENHENIRAAGGAHILLRLLSEENLPIREMAVLTLLQLTCRDTESRKIVTQNSGIVILKNMLTVRENESINYQIKILLDICCPVEVLKSTYRRSVSPFSVFNASKRIFTTNSTNEVLDRLIERAKQDKNGASAATIKNFGF